VAGNQGAPQPAPLDPSEQAALNATWQAPSNTPGMGGFLGDLGNKLAQTEAIQQGANAKAQLAQEVGSHAQMRVDPAQVEALAKFFEDEAQKLGDRVDDLQQLATIPAPGHDPVSSRAVALYAKVAAGDPQSYLDNYNKLGQIFQDTAANLRASAQQTRTDDEHAQHGFGGTNRG
jgi:hypothetical protein